MKHCWRVLKNLKILAPEASKSCLEALEAAPQKWKR